MLSDPLYLGEVTALPAHATDIDSQVTTIVPLQTISVGDGSSKRVALAASNNAGGHQPTMQLSVNHSLSKENQPYGTKRTLIRYDAFSNDSLGVPNNAFAYMLIGRPQSSEFSVADTAAYARALALFVLLGPSSSSSNWAGISSDTSLMRLLNGEA